MAPPPCSFLHGGCCNSISNEDWWVELEDVVVGKLWSKYRFGSLISSQGLICFPIKKQDSLSTFKPWLLGLTQELEEEIKRLKALPKPKQEVKQEIKQTTKPVETKEILGLAITCFWCFKFQLIFSLKDSFVFFCTFWFSSTDSIKCSSFDHFFWQFLGPWRWKFRKKKEKKFKQDPPPVPKPTTQEVTPTTEKEDVPPPVVEEDWQLIKNSI